MNQKPKSNITKESAESPLSARINELEREASLRTTQTNIANLLDILVTSNEDEIYNENVLHMRDRVSYLMGKFKTNLNGMQNEFESMLESFKKGKLMQIYFVVNITKLLC